MKPGRLPLRDDRLSRRRRRTRCALRGALRGGARDRDGRALRQQGLARLLLPEGGDGAARHALPRRAESARVRDRHALPLPGDIRALARGRAAVRHEGRAVRRPDRRGAHGDPRRAALGAQARPLSGCRQGRAARPRARRPRLLDHRRPPRPVADARERAEARLGRRARAVEGEPARRLERRRLLGVHPGARAPLQRAARSRLLVDRRHPLDAPRRRPRGPLGRHRQDRVRIASA